LYQKQVTEIQIENLSKIGPSDITHINSDQPTQPILKNYPQSKFGKEWRQFRPEWFKSYLWLENSVLEMLVIVFLVDFFLQSLIIHRFIKLDFKIEKKLLIKMQEYKAIINHVYIKLV
jgi:hypothetical protein